MRSYIPAFPGKYVMGGTVFEASGMTMRDYFAGQALVGMLSHPVNKAVNKADYAGEAYRYADAMLEERREVK